MKILSPPTVSKLSLEVNVERRGVQPVFIRDMFPALWDAAVYYGINPVVMVAQAGKETGWGKFGDVLTADFHNTCGLKTAKGGNDKDPNAHERSPTWFIGACKHAQHLLAYCRVMPTDDIIDPRFWIVWGNYGPTTSVLDLSAWATKPQYGPQLQIICNELNVESVLPLKTKVYARRPD